MQMQEIDNWKLKTSHTENLVSCSLVNNFLKTTKENIKFKSAMSNINESAAVVQVESDLDFSIPHNTNQNNSTQSLFCENIKISNIQNNMKTDSPSQINNTEVNSTAEIQVNNICYPSNYYNWYYETNSSAEDITQNLYHNTYSNVILETAKQRFYSSISKESETDDKNKNVSSKYNKNFDSWKTKASWYYHRNDILDKRKNKKKPYNYINKKDNEEKWHHDKYSDANQAPKSKEEIIKTYGYDIRNDKAPPGRGDRGK